MLPVGLGEVAVLPVGLGEVAVLPVGLGEVSALLLQGSRLTVCTNPTTGALMRMKPLGFAELSASVTCSLGARSLTASLVVSADLKTGICALATRHCPASDPCASFKLPSEVVISVPAIAGAMIPLVAIAITAKTLTGLPKRFIFSIR